MNRPPREVFSRLDVSRLGGPDAETPRFGRDHGSRLQLIAVEGQGMLDHAGLLSCRNPHDPRNPAVRPAMDDDQLTEVLVQRDDDSPLAVRLG